MTAGGARRAMEPTPARSASTARWAVLLTVTVAGVVLLGWVLGEPRLRSFIDPRWQTNPITALCHLLVALAVWLESRRELGGTLPVSRGIGAAVALVGGYQLTALLTGAVGRLDLHLWTWGTPPEMVARGAGVSVESALGFLGLGLALAVSDGRDSRRAWVVDWLAAAPFLFAVSSLVRFLYDTHPWSPKLATYVPMAASTCILFLASSVGVLAVNSHGPVRAALAGGTRTSRVLRGLLFGVFVILVAAGFAILWGFRRDLYGAGFGFSLMVTTGSGLLSLLLWLRTRELARAERELDRRAAELLELNRHLEAFSYSVSHDLRRPLRAVRGFGEILAVEHGDRLDAEGRRVLGVLRENADRMDRMTQDLLSFSRLAGHSLSVEPVDMDALADAAIRGQAERIAEIGVTVMRAERLPEAQGDAVMLHHVWDNLVANAVKYSAHQEGPRIEVGGHLGDDEAIYWVRDNGVGFDMRYSHKLFRVFQRLHPEREFQGSGVGLAIVQRVVERHGGRVWAVAAPGEGATFSFALPIVSDRRPEPLLD